MGPSLSPPDGRQLTNWDKRTESIGTSSSQTANGAIQVEPVFWQALVRLDKQGAAHYGVFSLFLVSAIVRLDVTSYSRYANIKQIKCFA